MIHVHSVWTVLILVAELLWALVDLIEMIVVLLDLAIPML